MPSLIATMNSKDMQQLHNRGWMKKIKKMVRGCQRRGIGEIRVMLEELFEGLVIEKLVPPFRERLF